MTMTRRKLFFATGIAFVLTIVIVTSFALGQGGIQPPTYSAAVKATSVAVEASKVALEVTAYARETRVAKLPTAPKDSIPEKFRFALTPQSSCPDTRIKSMIYDYRPMGPSWERGIVNTAVVIKNDVVYEVLAGSPTDIQAQGIVILNQLGMLIVRQQFMDPCAAGLAQKTLVPEYYYITAKGTLRITQIEGDTVVVSIAGAGIDRFNVVTGQFAQIKPLTITPIPLATRPPYPRP